MKIFVVAMVHLGYARILVLPVGGVRILLDRNSTPTGPAVEIMAGNIQGVIQVTLDGDRKEKGER